MFNYHKIDDPFLIYILKFSGNVDRKDIDSYKKNLKDILKSKKFYMIFDIIEVENFKTKYMMELFSEIKKVKDDFKINMNACSIITNKLCETALNLIFMVVKPFCESKIVRSNDEAIKFLCEVNILKESEQINSPINL